MEISHEFDNLTTPNNVCKLQKSLYGLKQLPKAWFDKFTKVVKQLGYSQSQADHTMSVKRSTSNKRAILIVYVDDIILTGVDFTELNKLSSKKSKLNTWETSGTFWAWRWLDQKRQS